MAETYKAVRVAACLRDTVFQKNYMSTHSKVKIFKTERNQSRLKANKTKKVMKNLMKNAWEKFKGQLLKRRYTTTEGHKRQKRTIGRATNGR